MGVESVLSNNRTKAMKNRIESGVAGRNMMGDLVCDVYKARPTAIVVSMVV